MIHYHAIRPRTEGFQHKKESDLGEIVLPKESRSRDFLGQQVSKRIKMCQTPRVGIDLPSLYYDGLCRSWYMSNHTVL